MGIEQFFSSIRQNSAVSEGSIETLDEKIEAENFFIDFNSIVHVVSGTVLGDLNYLLYWMIKGDVSGKKCVDVMKQYDMKKHDGWENYLEYVNSKIGDIIIEKVLDYVVDLLDRFIREGSLKFLNVAVDGVPNKAKMVEQKKRRYLGAIVSGLKEKMFEEYGVKIRDQAKYLYEKNKIQWHKVNISPGTIFMEKLEKKLGSEDFSGRIKNKCKNMVSYVFSGTGSFGEGEKKIIDCVGKRGIAENVVVFSPDTDMTLLCLLMSERVSGVKIIRHNQQDNNYDVVDIDVLRQNLLGYVKGKCKKGLDDGKVIVDLVFIFTIFGNDFVPKIESVSVRHDFCKLIDCYVEVVKNGKYLVDNVKVKICLDVFVEFMGKVSMYEKEMLENVYLSNHYQNYGRMKKIVSVDDNLSFVGNVSLFSNKLNMLQGDVKNGKFEVEKWLEDESKFLGVLADLLGEKGMGLEDFVSRYVENYKKNGKFKAVNITLHRYKKTLDDPYQRKKLELGVHGLDEKLAVTKYDEEVYKLDYLLDGFRKKLHAYPLEVGNVYLIPGTLSWKTGDLKDGMKKYYVDNFDKNRDEIVGDYLEGLVWVFRYYCGNMSGPSKWFYVHKRAPFLCDIFDFVKRAKGEYFDDLMEKVEKWDVDLDKYFSVVDHLVYVSPIDFYGGIMEGQDKYLEKKKERVSEIIDNVWKQDVSDDVDCSGALFLNKCHVNIDF